MGTLSIMMAVIGGVIATEKKTVRLSFLIMGLLSVIIVVFQAVRAAKSQDALTNEVKKVNRQQDELHDLSTGGDAFPSFWSMISLGPNKEPKSVVFYIKNHSSTRSLYSVAIDINHLGHGSLYVELHQANPPIITELAPNQQVRVPGEWDLYSPDDTYQLNISARNGKFVATLARSGEHWFWTVRRDGFPAVLDQTESLQIGTPKLVPNN